MISDGVSEMPCSFAILIEIEDLQFAYGTNQVLKGLDLKVPRGKVVAILGTSGSGNRSIKFSRHLVPGKR